MSADEFMQTGRGNSPANAFATAREEAAYEHGHGGYTGTLAEKSAWVMITMPDGFGEGTDLQRATKYANTLLEMSDPRVDDKWGPAGCIKVGPDPKHKGQNIYLFFGWASS